MHIHIHMNAIGESLTGYEWYLVLDFKTNGILGRMGETRHLGAIL